MSLVDIAIAAGAIAVAPFGKPAAIKRGCLIWVDAEGRVIINNCVKKPQPCEEAAKAVAGGGEHGVDGVAAGMGEVIAAHVVVLLEVADDRFNGGPPFEFALDLRREAALLAGDVDLHFVVRARRCGHDSRGRRQCGTGSRRSGSRSPG